MKIIGITGSIGMGKSTLANQLGFLGAKVCSSDAIVHRLMAKDGKATHEIKALFPDCVRTGVVDRKRLGEVVFASPEKRQLLEQIIHPLVAEEEEKFVIKAAAKGVRVVALDIPLLFETGADERVDRVVVATAPFFIQKRRVLARPGMSEERFLKILATQMPDHEKRARADDVVQTGLGKAYSMQKLKCLMEKIHA
jgi:dephospho-CoA kinase